MDTVKKIKLQKFREKIVQDLDVEHIIDGLITSGVINEAEKENIFQEDSRRDRVRHLLDLLPSKGPTAFDNFVGTLVRDYPWLYTQLKADIEPSLEEEKFLDALLLGGIPRTPPHNVERQHTLRELRKSLEFLSRGQYIVLHGMTGSGKSCLAAAALDCLPLVSKSFKDEQTQRLLLKLKRYPNQIKINTFLKLSSKENLNTRMPDASFTHPTDDDRKH